MSPQFGIFVIVILLAFGITGFFITLGFMTGIAP